MTAEPLPRVNVLGTGVSALNMRTAVDHVSRWLSDTATGRYLCVTGVHGVMEGLRSPEVRQAHNSASACVPDGMPMTWVGRLRGHRDMDRVYGPDLMLALLELSAREGFRNYFYGGAEGVADDLKLRMTRRFPGLKVVGTHCPPFRPLTADEQRDLVSDVNRLEPDLMWIGLSTPKQELFMSEFHTLLRCKVMIGVGAAFDFHTGRLRQAPRWMMRHGLEWFFRLCVEPRRLGPRYLRNNPAFVWHMLLQQTGIRRYTLT
jgi:N-acetylglucosaminyldiphosphoundecaprenol N-acetyl-beta-D-mannosaminyltransferase